MLGLRPAIREPFFISRAGVGTYLASDLQSGSLRTVIGIQYLRDMGEHVSMESFRPICVFKKSSGPRTVEGLGPATFVDNKPAEVEVATSPASGKNITDSFESVFSVRLDPTTEKELPAEEVATYPAAFHSRLSRSSGKNTTDSFESVFSVRLDPTTEKELPAEEVATYPAAFHSRLSRSSGKNTTDSFESVFSVRLDPTTEKKLSAEESNEGDKMSCNTSFDLIPTNYKAGYMPSEAPQYYWRDTGETVKMGLPSGFRFQPTDEELVAYYLKRKVENRPIGFEVIAEVDVYSWEPWDLPDKADVRGRPELEWYFYSYRDSKYRNNRATEAGYWKATGRDREVMNGGEQLVGMKKTLRFYMGRAPRGEKTNWVMHEYRLEGEDQKVTASQDAFVLCRVFNKSSGQRTLEGLGPATFVDNKPAEVDVFTSTSASTITTPISELLHSESLLSVRLDPPTEKELSEEERNEGDKMSWNTSFDLIATNNEAGYKPSETPRYWRDMGESVTMELPSGFRFHPTDEELVVHYLKSKMENRPIGSPQVIPELDVQKWEPWDLPDKAKVDGQVLVWYFYTYRDRKYLTGMRTNRVTEAGYWKASGKDREVMNAGKQLVGMKKTLVFYKGRAPRGEKTNWVMHEYRLEGIDEKVTASQHVVCRVFKKTLYRKWGSVRLEDVGPGTCADKESAEKNTTNFFEFFNLSTSPGETELVQEKASALGYLDTKFALPSNIYLPSIDLHDRRCDDYQSNEGDKMFWNTASTSCTTDLVGYPNSVPSETPLVRNQIETLTEWGADLCLSSHQWTGWGADLWPSSTNDCTIGRLNDWTGASSSNGTLRSDALALVDWTGASPSKGTLRSDALALGFRGFDTSFDSRRILLILFQSSQSGGDDEVIFLHHEGMTLLFGVGLPFSKVVLKSDGRIAVYEVVERIWTHLWVDEQIGSLILIDGESRMRGFHGEDGVHSASTQESMSCPKQSLKFSPQQNSLSPFSAFLGLIRLKSSVGSVGGMSSGAVSTETNNNENTGVDKFNEIAGRVAAVEFEKEAQTQKEVTIEIHLDPYTCTCEGSSTPELMSQLIEPVLRLTFFKESKGGQILKRFSTALEFLFFMRGELKSDRIKFGWYHDELKLSFKCLSRNAATVDTKGIERSCEVIRGRDRSTSASKILSDKNTHVCGGATSGGLKSVSVSTDNSSDETEDVTTGFAMKLQGGPGEIGCLASIADDYDIWDQKGRRDAFFLSGRMADTLLSVNGDWRIWTEGLCRYELMGTRNFIKKSTGTHPNAVGWKFVENSKGRQEYEERVAQNIRKVFEIDHSFSFFENLRSWDEWHVAHNAVAPRPISDIIDTVSISSSGCPENRESESVTQSAETIAQTPEHAVNSGFVTYPTGSPSEVTDMLEVLEDANRTTLPSTTVSDMTNVLQVTKDHLNGARVAKKLNDYMYELYTPTEEPDMEIILVHGLKLDDTDNLHLSTWISEDVGTYHVWPKTWLAQDFSHARVLTVTYDSHLYQTAEQGRIDLHLTAESLINCLFLEVGEESCRPLILVGYSFGGILIKQLCLHASQKKGSRHYGSKFESFMKRIRAIYFMGTPHRGMIHPGFGTGTQENASPLFKNVELLNKYLARLHETFELLRESYDWQVSGIGETNETRWGMLQTVLVIEASARYGEPFTTVQADHISLSKPTAKTSVVYRQLKELIKQAYKGKVILSQ